MKTILLVDDEPQIAQLYGNALEKSGYRVITAENGLDAIKKAMEEKPDIILMDVSMPVMDGLEATRKLKASDSKTSDIPVIALTSMAMPDEIQAGLEAGCDGYVIKPTHPNELVHELKNVINNLEEEPQEHS